MLIEMGGNSNSRPVSVECEDTARVVFVKGIRMTDRVVDRMREFQPPQQPQSKSSSCSPVNQPLTAQNETSAPTEPLTPVLPHPPSYSSVLVPPPLQETLRPHVPLVSESQGTPASAASTSTVESTPSLIYTAPKAVPSVQEPVATSTPTAPVPPAPASEPLSASTSILASSDPVLLTPPFGTVPVVLSPSLEATDASPSPAADTVVPSTPIELIDMPLTDRLTAAPVETIPLSTSIESTVPPTPTPTRDITIPAEQVDLPAKPMSQPLTEIERPLSTDIPHPAPTESLEILDIPPVSLKPSDLPRDPSLPNPLSSTLTVLCEAPKMGQMESPSNQHTSAPTHTVQPVPPPRNEPVRSPTSPQAVVNEEDLRKQIRDELQKLLQEEMKTVELKIQQQLEEEKVKAEAEAQAKAQQQIQAEVQKVLEKEQLVLQQTLKEFIMQERKNIQVEQLASQYYIQKLQEKERYLAKQDLLYKDHTAKLEKKAAQFTRVTAESFNKGLEETHKRFKRYQSKPVCSMLQSEILKCYLQNTSRSLTCSSIAAQYVRCVNDAKQNKKVSTMG